MEKVFQTFFFLKINSLDNLYPAVLRVQTFQSSLSLLLFIKLYKRLWSNLILPSICCCCVQPPAQQQQWIRALIYLFSFSALRQSSYVAIRRLTSARIFLSSTTLLHCAKSAMTHPLLRSKRTLRNHCFKNNTVYSSTLSSYCWHVRFKWYKYPPSFFPCLFLLFSFLLLFAVLCSQLSLFLHSFWLGKINCWVSLLLLLIVCLCVALL